MDPDSPSFPQTTELAWSVTQFSFYLLVTQPWSLRTYASTVTIVFNNNNNNNPLPQLTFFSPYWSLPQKSHRTQTQTHAGQESRERPQKLELIAAVFFDLLRKRWKLTPMILDLINRQIRSMSPWVHFPCRGGQHYWISSL